jgi:hypothetical protein
MKTNMKLTRVKFDHAVGTIKVWQNDYILNYEGTTYVVSRMCNTGPGYSWVARDLAQTRETFSRGTLKRLKETLANAHLRDAWKRAKNDQATNQSMSDFIRESGSLIF